MTNEDVLFRTMLVHIDRVQMGIIHKDYPDCMWDKFFDVESFARRGAEHALRLNTLLAPHSTALDLGAAFGYVALGLNVLGHRCEAYDQRFAVLERVSRCMPNVPRLWGRIDPDYVPHNLYDCIIAHGLVPMRRGNDWREGPGIWTADDYRRFAGNLIGRLKPNGYMEWIVNRGDEGLPALDPSVWKDHQDAAVTVIDNMVMVFKKETVPCAVS